MKLMIKNNKFSIEKVEFESRICEGIVLCS